MAQQLVFPVGDEPPGEASDSPTADTPEPAGPVVV
jgi:hypothetical protein